MSTASVFVSYAWRDRHRARLVEDALAALGHRTFLDDRDGDRSADFSTQIERAIRGADYFVVCVTPDVAREDSFVPREIRYAQDEDARRRAASPPGRLPIIVVVFPGGVTPLLISTWTPLTVDEGTTAEALAERIGDWMRRPRVSASVASPALARYLEGFVERVDELLRRSVDGFLELSATERRGLTRAAEPAFRAFRVSPALAAVRGASERTADGAARETFATVGEAGTRYGNRLLIVGAPGAGKTTALLAVARAAALDCLTDASHAVPVLAQLGEWTPGQHVVEWATNGERALAGRPLLLLLDGLDEIVSAERPAEAREGEAPNDPSVERRRAFLHALARDYPDGAVIVTCRVSDFERLALPAPLAGAVEIAELDDDQIAEYLRAAGIDPSAVTSNGALLALARRPLLLALIRAALGATGSDLSAVRTEYDVFDRFVAERFRHEAARGVPLPFTESWTREALGRLAARRMIELGSLSAFTREELAVAAGAEHAEAFAEFCVRMHFLSGPAEGPAFTHLRVRDFFSLPTLLDVFDAGYGWKPWWAPERHLYWKIGDLALAWTGSFAVAPLRDRALAAAWARDAAGGRCVPREVEAAQYRGIETLGAVGPAAYPALAEIASVAPSTRRDVARVLAKSRMAPALAVPVLAAMLGAGSDDDAVLEALGDIDEGSAVPPLLAWISDPAKPHRGAAARALFRLRRFNRAGFPGALAEEVDADVRPWAAADAILRAAASASSAALPRDAVVEIVAALGARRCHTSIVGALRDVDDPAIVDAIVAAARRELDLTRRRAAPSDPALRAALAAVVAGHGRPGTLDVVAAALRDRGTFRRRDEPHSVEVRDGATSGLYRLGTPTARGILSHDDSAGVADLAIALGGDPGAALAGAAERIAPAPRRDEGESRLAGTVAAAATAVAAAGSLFWWPSVALAVLAWLATVRRAPRGPWTVVVALGPDDERLFDFYQIEDALPPRRPVVFLTRPRLPLDPSARAGVVAMTALLALGTAVALVARGAGVAGVYVVVTALALVRQHPRRRRWGAVALLLAVAVGRALTLTTHISPAIAALVAVASILALVALAVAAAYIGNTRRSMHFVLTPLRSVMASAERHSVARTLGTPAQLARFAAELDGGGGGARRRWIWPVPSNYQVVPCVDWALGPAAAVAARRAGLVVIDVASSDPGPVLDEIREACARAGVAVICTVARESDRPALVARGVAPEAVRVWKYPRDRDATARIDPSAAPAGAS